MKRYNKNKKGGGYPKPTDNMGERSLNSIVNEVVNKNEGFSLLKGGGPGGEEVPQFSNASDNANSTIANMVNANNQAEANAEYDPFSTMFGGKRHKTKKHKKKYNKKSMKKHKKKSIKKHKKKYKKKHNRKSKKKHKLLKGGLKKMWNYTNEERKQRLDNLKKGKHPNSPQKNKPKRPTKKSPGAKKSMESKQQKQLKNAMIMSSLTNKSGHNSLDSNIAIEMFKRGRLNNFNIIRK